MLSANIEQRDLIEEDRLAIKAIKARAEAAEREVEEWHASSARWAAEFGRAKVERDEARAMATAYEEEIAANCPEDQTLTETMGALRAEVARLALTVAQVHNGVRDCYRDGKMRPPDCHCVLINVCAELNTTPAGEEER